MLRSTMARLGILRGGDLRCLSATFMVVVFFCCVFMLSLQPSHYPTKLSMVDLPKDEVVRAQSIPALAPTPTQTSSTKTGGSGKEGKKNAKAEQKANKNDKKAAKAKWIKDELPKKLHTGHVRNNTKAKGDGAQDSSNKTWTDVNVPSSPDAPRVEADPKVTKTSPNKTEPEQPREKPREQVEKAREVRKEASQAEPAPQAAVQPPPPPAASASSQAPLRPKTSFSNLNEVPVHTFTSPFIETKGKGAEKKKVITWYRAEDEREVNRQRKVLESCPEPQCKLLHPLPDGVRADAVVFDGVFTEELPPARADADQVSG